MEPPVIPFACIKKNDVRTYCGNQLSERHFVFTDAVYAAKIYASSSKALRACPFCVEEVRKLFPGMFSAPKGSL